MAEVSDGQDFYDEGYDDDEDSLNNRIEFRQDKLYGRQEELETLHTLYTRLCSQGSVPCMQKLLLAAESPVTLISGHSGAGKSFLVNRFVEELDGRAKKAQVKPFMFLSGKYEELQCVDPLSAIVEAFSGLCNFLLQESEKENLERVRGLIQEALGREANALITVVPDLKHIIGTHKGEALSGAASTDSGWHRLRYLFQTLLKAICNEHYPIIMFLDDLQWADSASLDLIGALLKDKSLRHFMFIGAVRGNEMGKGHPMNKLLETTETIGKKVKRIDLLSRSIEDIGEFIADTLSLDVKDCRPLTEAIHGKTRGNLFFAMQSLEELHRANVLYYSVITFQWEWNLEGVELKAGLSDNLDVAVAAKIKSAPEKLQKALVIASYTRSTIDIQSLKTLMIADNCDIDSEELVKILDMAVMEGLLLNSVGSPSYRFAHDHIQQAAYSLVPSGPSREKLRSLIGRKLFELASADVGQDWMLFIAADHLNSCTNHGQDSLFLAKLNLSCGVKAVAVAAYVPASVYLRLALKSLQQLDDHWESHYSLSLRLFRSICDIELCLGKFDSGNHLGQEAISHAKNLQDRLPTFLSLAISKGKQHRHAEAVELCQVALLELGATPKRCHALHMLKDHQIVKRLLKKHSDSDILLFSKLKNEKKLAAVGFLSECALRAYSCGDLVESMFCTLRLLRITFKFGLSGASATAFANYGAFLGGQCGDHDGGLRMTRLARQVLDRTSDSKPHKAATLMVCGFYIEAWSCPRDKVLDTGQQAHLAGMQCGNLELGFVSWVFCNLFAFHAGYPLDPIERTGQEILEQSQLYNVDNVRISFLEMRRPIRYLLGRVDEPLDWAELEAFAVAVEHGNSSEKYLLIFGYLGRLELGVFFGQLEFAARISDLLQPHLTHDSSYTIVSRNVFLSGLTFSGLARKTLSRKHLSRAAAFAKQMTSMSRTRGLNVLHKSLLMKADLLASQSKNIDKVVAAYDEAIYTAVKIGYTNDAALGSEIAGEFFLSIGKLTRARQYLHQARDLYHEVSIPFCWACVAAKKRLLR
jgi:predicted ATPase